MKKQLTFAMDGAEFIPVAFVVRVEEPDFGCEGVPEGHGPQGTLLIQNAVGEKRLCPILQELLLHTRFDDGIWIGWRQGRCVLVRKNGAWFPVNALEADWLNGQVLQQSTQESFEFYGEE